jgi:hypothetical protein
MAVEIVSVGVDANRTRLPGGLDDIDKVSGRGTGSEAQA